MPADHYEIMSCSDMEMCLASSSGSFGRTLHSLISVRNQSLDTVQPYCDTVDEWMGRLFREAKSLSHASLSPASHQSSFLP